MHERLAKGIRKYISEDLKPEARKAQSEEESWISTQEILKLRVEKYPEAFLPAAPAIRDYYKRRWGFKGKTLSSQETKEMMKGFYEKYPDEILDQAGPVFSVITQILSRP
ncbi:MAG: hypothetical protein V1808_04710 [Candidatus Daviesbacteria bacterium]